MLILFFLSNADADGVVCADADGFVCADADGVVCADADFEFYVAFYVDVEYCYSASKFL
jgi:hypothetical protein